MDLLPAAHSLPLEQKQKKKSSHICFLVCVCVHLGFSRNSTPNWTSISKTTLVLVQVSQKKHWGVWDPKERLKKAGECWSLMEGGWGVEGAIRRKGEKKKKKKEAEYGPQGSFPQRRVTLGLWINAVCATVPYRGTDNTERDQEGICLNTSFLTLSYALPPTPLPLPHPTIASLEILIISQPLNVNKVGVFVM